MAATRQEIIRRLQQDLLRWQGFKAPQSGEQARMGLGRVEDAFPLGVFPTGSLHEFLCGTPDQAAACSGFLGGLLSRLMQQGSACIWVSSARKLFPPSLKIFGVEPDRIIFVDVRQERELLWITEEALKCEGLAAVVTELQDITFPQVRRLQLAVEHSGVTGFLLRTHPQKVGATTCVARWRISPLPSEPEDELPGVGFPRWEVELLKVRNGRPGNWQMEWAEGVFTFLEEKSGVSVAQSRKAG